MHRAREHGSLSARCRVTAIRPAAPFGSRCIQGDRTTKHGLVSFWSGSQAATLSRAKTSR
jgi:hypothetical protein